jgi:inosine-uridine nucleoside N-ribohydrolase
MDVKLDDGQAILWLLKWPDIDIKAIMVTGTGWASLASGMTNIFNMLTFMGREDIPVTGAAPMPSTVYSERAQHSRLRVSKPTSAPSSSSLVAVGTSPRRPGPLVGA